MKKNKKETQLLQKEIFNINIKSKICKIILSSGKIYYGFFMKSYKGENPFYFLVSNEIDKSLQKVKEKIDIYYDNMNKHFKISIHENERFIHNYKYLNINTTIIEILPKDNMNENYFLLPHPDYIDNYDNLKNIKIDIFYKEGDDINYTNGEIKSINQYEFIYLSNNKYEGIPGTPIFQNGTRKIIGINQKEENNENKNYGNCIGPIINSLKLNLEYKLIINPKR